MPFYTWTEELDVKVVEMNQEHQELIRRMNFLFDRNETKADRTEILKAIQDLAEYTVQHFRDEEAFMEKIQYEGLPTHKVIHKQLLEQFNRFVSDYENASDAHVSEKFFDFLSVWLTSHIKGIDSKYSQVAVDAKMA